MCANAVIACCCGEGNLCPDRCTDCQSEIRVAFHFDFNYRGFFYLSSAAPWRYTQNDNFCDYGPALSDQSFVSHINDFVCNGTIFHRAVFCFTNQWVMPQTLVHYRDQDGSEGEERCRDFGIVRGTRSAVDFGINPPDCPPLGRWDISMLTVDGNPVNDNQSYIIVS